MNASTQSSPVSRWRHACAAVVAGSALATLLVACGGGGGDAPAGTATAQSFASGPITGLGSVIVNGVRFDDSNARVEDDDGVSHGSRDLKLGMMVEIQAGSIDDNSARATAERIRFGSEIVGRVDSIDATAQTLGVLGQTIEVKSTTVFEDGLAGFGAITKDQVLEIHAQFDAASGRYVATRIESEAGATVFRLRGVVRELVNTATEKTFKIGNAVINFADIAPADLPAAFADGQRVRVRLKTTQAANGQWVAISVRTGMRKVEDHGDARLRGMISVFRTAQDFEIQGIVVDARNARFEPNAEAVKLGALVEVRGMASAGKIVASRVKVRNERDDDLQRVELHGSVSALDTTAQTFMLREVKIDYSKVMEWKDGAAADLADPVKSLKVEVKGVWSADRKTLIAAVIEFES